MVHTPGGQMLGGAWQDTSPPTGNRRTNFFVPLFHGLCPKFFWRNIPQCLSGGFCRALQHCLEVICRPEQGCNLQWLILAPKSVRGMPSLLANLKRRLCSMRLPQQSAFPQSCDPRTAHPSLVRNCLFDPWVRHLTYLLLCSYDSWT
jgi:hypothetical protein